MQADKIIIIDFGSQYTKLIARKVRECHVFSEIIPCTGDLEQLKNDPALKGVILSGGPMSVFVKNAPALSKQIIDLGVPVLGICYGLQLLSHHFKGNVTEGKTREFGKTHVHITSKSVILEGVSKKLTVWMSHGDYVKKLPAGFKPTSRSENGLISTFQHIGILSLEFHVDKLSRPLL